MVILYNNDLDGICSVAIVIKYFNDLGINIDDPIPIHQNSINIIKNIKINETVYILDYFLNNKDWLLLFSKTKNIIWISKYNTNNKTTCFLTWKFFFGIKSVPYSILLINDCILNNNKYGEISNNFKYGLKLINIISNKDIWINLLNDITFTVNTIIYNGKIINSFCNLLTVI
jgi:hypothetical protein